MSALPSLRQLSYLVKLSETLSFTQAAQGCFVSQSTLSGGIQELERLLGVQLVERDRHHVRMTDIGLHVVERARTLLSVAHDLVTHANQAGESMTGLIKLGAIPTIAPFLLPRILRASRTQYPKLKIALREDPSAALLGRIRDGALDFGLIALPYDTTGLRVMPLFREDLWLIARSDDRLAQHHSLNLAELDLQNMLLLEDGHCLKSHVLEGCGLRENANRSGFEASSLTTLVSMVEEGLGFTVLPDMALQAGILDGTPLIARPLRPTAPQRTIALVARLSTAHLREYTALAEIAQAVHPNAPRSERPT